LWSNVWVCVWFGVWGGGGVCGWVGGGGGGEAVEQGFEWGLKALPHLWLFAPCKFRTKLKVHFPYGVHTNLLASSCTSTIHFKAMKQT